ncbi:MAG: hypothetical protein GXP55_02510 [Deltaproteobacteria bacterium]|nr:hypothetical protein [Deltaproteobacteria bacterium]
MNWVRSTWIFLGFLGLSLGSAGCASSTVLTSDAGSDDAGTAERCGAADCLAGQLCCAGCGVGEFFCSEPGPAGGCPLVGCPPPVRCGEIECSAGDACCTDCGGAPFCSTEGLCPSTPCPAPPSCGGYGGTVCDSGHFCDYDPAGGACGALDGSGVCAPRPATCTGVLDPVCGCDGADYGNACSANAAGTDVASYGTCAAPVVDCRTTGCPAGQGCGICGPAGSGYVCVPNDVDC